MTIALRAKDLSKKYVISHQSKQSYGMLRDVISQKFSDAGQRLRHPWRSSSNELMTGLSGTEEFWALKDVNFDIQQGEIVGIVGSNGAGKSTLLKILSRITEPTSGYIAINGKVNSLLEVGTGFHAELTGRENLFLNGSILGMSKSEIKARFDEIVAFAEVEQFLDTPMKRYSSGMQVRLAFAIAVHLISNVLIVDEVLAVGDTSFQRKCISKMHDFASREGRTVLFVSHNITLVQDFCSRCLLLDKGQIVSEGAPKKVIGEYLGSFGADGGQSNDLQVSEEEHAFIRRLSLSSNKSATVYSGEKMRVAIELENLASCPAPELELTVKNVDGLAIFSIRKDLVPTREYLQRHERGKLVWEIDNLPLLSGRYWLNGTLIPGPREAVQPLEKALVFTVTNPDENLLPKGAHQSRGLIALEGQWSSPSSPE